MIKLLKREIVDILNVNGILLLIIKLNSLVIILSFTYLLPSYGHVQLQFRKMEPHQTLHICIVHLWIVELMTELQNILLSCVTEKKSFLYFSRYNIINK